MKRKKAQSASDALMRVPAGKANATAIQNNNLDAYSPLVIMLQGVIFMLVFIFVQCYTV